jgi:DNA polymerase-1
MRTPHGCLRSELDQEATSGGLRLLANGAHLEDLDTLDRLTGATGHLIHHQWDQLILWRALIQLRTDIPLPTTIGTHQPSSLPSAPDIIGALDLWK